jgi:hypothetical protein
MDLAKRTAALDLIELNFGSASLSYAGWKLVTQTAKKAAAARASRPPSHQRRLDLPKKIHHSVPAARLGSRAHPVEGAGGRRGANHVLAGATFRSAVSRWLSNLTIAAES